MSSEDSYAYKYGVLKAKIDLTQTKLKVLISMKKQYGLSDEVLKFVEDILESSNYEDNVQPTTKAVVK